MSHQNGLREAEDCRLLMQAVLLKHFRDVRHPPPLGQSKTEIDVLARQGELTTACVAHRGGSHHQRRIAHRAPTFEERRYDFVMIQRNPGGWDDPIRHQESELRSNYDDLRIGLHERQLPHEPVGMRDVIRVESREKRRSCLSDAAIHSRSGAGVRLSHNTESRVGNRLHELPRRVS
ncbi:MAG TPA: hypothetical protein PKC18_17820 [Lacipirellulaceae bacterium]|nr:hypothetical protein [Lacipirellulaceae bacterium]